MNTLKITSLKTLDIRIRGPGPGNSVARDFHIAHVALDISRFIICVLPQAYVWLLNIFFFHLNLTI